MVAAGAGKLQDRVRTLLVRWPAALAIDVRGLDKLADDERRHLVPEPHQLPRLGVPDADAARRISFVGKADTSTPGRPIVFRHWA